MRRAPRPSPGIRAALPFPEKMFLGEMAISPDGRRLAFTATKAGGQPDLWIRNLDGSSAQPVVGVFCLTQSELARARSQSIVALAG